MSESKMQRLLKETRQELERCYELELSVNGHTLCHKSNLCINCESCTPEQKTAFELLKPLAKLHELLRDDCKKCANAEGYFVKDDVKFCVCPFSPNAVKRQDVLDGGCLEFEKRL